MAEEPPTNPVEGQSTEEPQAEAAQQQAEADQAQTTEQTEQIEAATEQPTEQAEVPIEPTTEQTEAPIEPSTEQTEAPIDDQPTGQIEPSTEQTEAPTDDQPTGQIEPSTEQADQSLEQTAPPSAEQTKEPSEQAEQATDEAEAPHDQTEQSSEQTVQPEQAEQPTEQVGQLADQDIAKPTEDAAEPIEQTIDGDTQQISAQDAIVQENKDDDPDKPEAVQEPTELQQVAEPEQNTEETPAAPLHEETQSSPEKPAVGQVAASTTPIPTDQQEPEVDPHACSPTPRGTEQTTAQCTVKFMLMPSGQVHTERCGLNQSLLELKQHLSSELRIPAPVIMLTKDGKETEDHHILSQLGVGPNGTVQLEILSADPPNYPIKTLKKRQDYQMPDVITVRVLTETDEIKDVVVEIERATRKKPFLGGYKHKKNGVEYHHAAAQTMQKPRPPSNVEKYCRDTQTAQQKHDLQQTANDMATQMTKIGVYVSNIPDKLIIPKKYTTAQEYRKNIYDRVLIIQKYYRRWLAKRYVERVRVDKATRLEWEREEELKKKKEKADRIKREFERRMNPKIQEDFDLLYHALEKWRQEELERINIELTGAERKAALCQLLDQETQLIASIGRHKLDADDENKTRSIQGFLEKAAAPKKWKGRDGKVTEMDTPYTIRAQELRDIYNSINMKYLTQDERLDVLLTLKHTVKEHDCKLTQEIIELIDREADLLMRGVKESNLEGLRRRISTLFLQYIKTPTFNPEAARLLKVPQDPSVLRKDIYFCPSCNQYKPSTDFQLSSNSSSVGRCRKCHKVDNDARIRQDYSHYRYMVKSLRRSEEAYNDGSHIAFLLQESDLRYLVENVWNSQSILSAWEDLYDLVLVRWDKHLEWSPWNCILITKEESSSHVKLQNLDEAYGKTLVHKVKHKHTLARNYFSRIPGMAEHLRSSSNIVMPHGPSVSGTKVPVAQVH